MKRQTSLITGTCFLALTFAVIGCGRPSNTALMNQGDYAMWQGRWADAATNYEKAAEQHPGEWEAQFKLGQCYLEMGDPLQACHALSIAESIQPENIEIADLLATALMESDNRDGLYTFLQTRATKVQTTRAWTKFAEYSMAMDDPDTAVQAINTAIVLNTNQSAYPYIVAATFAERLGDDTLAVKHWKDAWSIDPTNERISSALRSHGEVPGPTMTGISTDSEH